ncbi:hypothetical protein PpBr36_03446 [Pyricularia pennisetigena]|uniref:hypothetical protein n=1 Tax=Pyricularia pennisetigena TaxID=1578925 RepID=UPI00114ED109|nr:hypothetical protein PpBr36_03446 [Pyricularia pennisetigena]TLS30533.1 hypothetical protein PpBr36_03446 [Pyricularia pennisetigena]
MRPSTSTNVALAALLAVLGVDAHMIMSKPTPYNLNGQAPLLQTSPLGPDFAFPGQGLSRVVEMNKYTAGGAPIEVQFTGSAMHKGGSCQFSVAPGTTPPTDPKAWKVISSIIGGCPGETDGEGNLQTIGQDPEGRPTAKQCGSFGEKECIKTFKIPVPKELASGTYSFAWTWFNTVGNREMYMNMAPIEISGGASEAAGQTYLDSLPSIFVANIKGNPISTCTTSPGVLNFPEPGKVGMVLQAPTAGSSGSCQAPAAEPSFSQDIRAMQDGGAAPAPPSGGSDDSNDSNDGDYGDEPAGAAPPTTTDLPDSVYINPPATPTTLATVVKDPETAAPPAGTPMPAPDAGTGGLQGTKVACATDGSLICIGARQFGICNYGYAMPQDLAAGTVCADGKIAKRSV